MDEFEKFRPAETKQIKVKETEEETLKTQETIPDMKEVQKVSLMRQVFDRLLCRSGNRQLLSSRENRNEFLETEVQEVVDQIDQEIVDQMNKQKTFTML